MTDEWKQGILQKIFLLKELVYQLQEDIDDLKDEIELLGIIREEK